MPGFDLAQLDSRTLSEKGVKFIVRDPRTNRPFRNDDNEEVYILLAGRNSERFEALQEAANKQRTEMAARNIDFTAAHVRQERAEYVAGCTLGWNFGKLDGDAFPYSEGNARHLWEDKRFNWLMNATFDFLLNEANFLAGTPDA